MLIAGGLMTSPAITIGPDATMPAAARLMEARHVRRLPVVDGQGKIVGIVSRRDLLRVFLRPDADIAADVRNMLGEILPGEADVAVRNGIVTLTGTRDPAAAVNGGLMPLAIRLMWNIDGVVDVVNKIDAEAAPPAEPLAAGDAVDAEGAHTERGQGDEAVSGSSVQGSQP